MPPKNARVKPPRKHGDSSEQNVARLQSAIEQIQLKKASELSFEEHYRYAYNLVLHKNGHLLYNSVADLIGAHLEEETKSRILPYFPPSTSSVITSGSTVASENLVAAAAGTLFLDRVREVWVDHMACMSKLRDILKYMDKVYTGTPSLPSTWDLGLSLFFDRVVLFSSGPTPKVIQKVSTSSRTALSNTSTSIPARSLPTSDPLSVSHHLITTLLNVIRIEREGEVVSQYSIANTVAILSELTDEGPVALPIAASTGPGAGKPAMGVGSGGGSSRGGAVMGVRSKPSAKLESPYTTSFEQAFLDQSELFYQRESAALLFECDAPGFLIKIERRLAEEALRAQTYLAPQTESVLILLLEKTLIEAHLEAVLDHPASGLTSLIQDSRLGDLKRLYTLFGRVSTGHEALQKGILSWITIIGKQINDGLLVVAGAEVPTMEADLKGKGKAREGAPKPVTDTSSLKTRSALSWVQQVLSLKDKFEILLAQAFNSDKAFERSINDAFTTFVNKNEMAPEFISLFIDDNLKKSLKGKSEEEVDSVLKMTVGLFRFLTEKDRFEHYYNTHLSKRLISKNSVSDDAERNMLAKFKIEAGAAFTRSAEGMLQDVKVSQDALPEFKRQQDGKATKKAPYDMSTIVCGSNCWPFERSEAAVTLPNILSQGVLAFTEFYDSKHSGRILTFRTDYGNVEVKAKFKLRSHELNVSTNAMVVLALFEELGDDEPLSYGDIASATGMKAAHLVQTLQSLACAKFRILAKEPKGRDVNESDKFTYNTAFTSPLAKIKIQTVANKVESTEEKKKTDGKVDEARNTLCEACIVRVMKDRKVLLLQELLNEVIQQLMSRFQAPPNLIKRAVDRLIEREYLERDPNNRSRLTYVA